MIKKNIRVATRASLLAITQTRQTVALLEHAAPQYAFEIIPLTTTGDRVTDRPLSQFRGIGVFVKELEKALAENKADIAVHSLKDVPVEQVAGLILASFPLRKSPADVLLTQMSVPFAGLRKNAVVGTSSPRRVVQLKAWRADLVFKDLRGNLDTRIKKLENGDYDGIVAAAAGMQRIGRTYEESSVLPMSICLPAAGQGCLAIECREDDEQALSLVQMIDDKNTRIAAGAERAFLKAMGGGCQTPIAVYATLSDHTVTVSGAVGEPDSGRIVKDTVNVPILSNENAGELLAKKLLALCKVHSIKIEP